MGGQAARFAALEAVGLQRRAREIVPDPLQYALERSASEDTPAEAGE